MDKQKAEHFFRHEYGRLVAKLAAKVGICHVELIEDAVQSALLTAVESWQSNDSIENSTAWLYSVASNRLIDNFRQQQNRSDIIQKFQSDFETEFQKPLVPESNPSMQSEIEDDLLNMMFISCHPDINEQSTLVFTLKTLCGFSIKEIALRLFATQQSIYKRYQRVLIELAIKTNIKHEPKPSELIFRRSRVLRLLYLMFTQGYLSVNEQRSIQPELCLEAIRLTQILAKHSLGQFEECYALLALMFFQYSRIDSRLDNSGGLVLLENQDRSKWDQSYIAEGLNWLQQSASGEVFTRYHAEAGVAGAHCLASSFDKTDWTQIIDCYEILQQFTSSPIHQLNHAIALTQTGQTQLAIELIQQSKPPSWLQGSYQWYVVLAYLYKRLDEESASKSRQVAKNKYNEYKKTALDLAPNTAIRDLILHSLN